MLEVIKKTLRRNQCGPCQRSTIHLLTPFDARRTFDSHDPTNSSIDSSDTDGEYIHVICVIIVIGPRKSNYVISHRIRTRLRRT